MIVAASILKTRSDVRFRRLDREGVVLLQGAARVFGVNELGIRILEQLDGRRSVAEIVRTLAEGAGVSEEVLTKDGLDFLGKLAEKGVVQEVGP